MLRLLLCVSIAFILLRQRGENIQKAKVTRVLKRTLVIPGNGIYTLLIGGCWLWLQSVTFCERKRQPRRENSQTDPRTIIQQPPLLLHVCVRRAVRCVVHLRVPRIV
jgi:hypothetical protein